MENNFSVGSQKIAIIISCIVAIILGLLILNKIETAPQKIPAEVRPVPQIVKPSSPDGTFFPGKSAATSASVKEIPAEKEYPKQVIV